MKYLKWIILLGVIGGWFYWFQYRPSLIRKDCSKLVWDTTLKKFPHNQDMAFYDYNNYYPMCLKGNGLKIGGI